MRAVLFEIYHDGGKDQLHIDRKWRPKIQPYTDNTCAIIGYTPRMREKVFARFGINHSVVCKGEVFLKDVKDAYQKMTE